METIRLINYFVAIAFTACYFYQFVYILVPFVIKHKPHRIIKENKYAVLISARNEEAVIAQLIESIRMQDYPSKLVKIFVVADNCTDGTAKVARDAGAEVWERFNKSQIGKGYALDFLISRINETYPQDAFDGYFVFDADNLLNENYITEMNKTFSDGHRIITSYRNSKNYGTNWISAGYSLWFLRESKYLNNARMLLGTSCAVSGTGFLVHKDIIEKNDGWKFFLLTEDIEFSVHSVINDERIAFCKDAILYDEQPSTFGQAWTQRMRWAKGFFQVFNKYGLSLLKNIFTKGSFACFDMAMTIMPAVMLTVFSVTINIFAAAISLYLGDDVTIILESVWETVRNVYLTLLVIGTITVITEWSQIHCRIAQKIVYIFTFPIFMLTYIPISVAALFSPVEWKPIQHSEVKTLAEVRGEIR